LFPKPKNMKRFACLLVFWGLVAARGQAQETYAFFQGTYNDLLAKARKENKPFFLYFYTNWCQPCRKINNEAFRDAAVVAFGQKEYLGYALDAESAISEGRKLAKYYNVYFFPMFIICTPQGKVVERLDGYQTPKEMLAALKRNVTFRGEPTGQYLYLNDDPPMSGNLDPVGKGLYKFSFESLPSEGYGWQVGVYESYEGLLRQTNELQKKFHRNILVHVDEVKGKTAYRLILGPFNSQRAALTYGEVLKAKEGTDGVVVHLAGMK
jgi:thiol-disulfide isomerase/thioredoxin